MHIWRFPRVHAAPPAQRVALSIGSFDGVHLGHLGLLDRLRRDARARGLPVAVLTFDPHPREWLNPRAAPQRIGSLRDKLAWLHAAGVDEVHVARFGPGLAAMDAADFVRRVLVGHLGAQHLLIGDDFRFGHRRAGDLSLLQSLAPTLGYQVSAMGTLVQGGQRLSSSRVREALGAGDLAMAEQLLGRPYRLQVRVAGHDARGLWLSLRLPTLALQGRHYAMLTNAQGLRVLGRVERAAGARPDGASQVMLRLQVETPVPGDWLGQRIALQWMAPIAQGAARAMADAQRAQSKANVPSATSAASGSRPEGFSLA